MSWGEVVSEVFSRPMYYDRSGRGFDDTLEWVRLRQKPGYLRVGGTRLGRRWVSTVWLGMDHSFGCGPPLIFETMVFPDQWMTGRWATEAEAIAGHADAVQMVRKRRLGKVPRTASNRYNRHKLRRTGQMIRSRPCPVKPSVAGKRPAWR